MRQYLRHFTQGLINQSINWAELLQFHLQFFWKYNICKQQSIIMKKYIKKKRNFITYYAKLLLQHSHYQHRGQYPLYCCKQVKQILKYPNNWILACIFMVIMCNFQANKQGNILGYCTVGKRIQGMKLNMFPPPQ